MADPYAQESHRSTGTCSLGECINHRYRVVGLLGRGGMGTVYLVEDLIKYQRLVAMKVLSSDHLEDPDLWTKGEYEALIRLRHPGLARVHDFGRIQETNDFYIVSEFIRGEDLFTATREMPFDELLDVISQICRALDFIHMQGYVHFDIKPGNILVTRDREEGSSEGSKVQWSPDRARPFKKGTGPPRIKLIDFGLAEQVTGSFDFAIKGTLNYLAPEIMQGLTPDRRADLYSLGVTLYKVLTGYVPFVGDDGRAYSRNGTNWRRDVQQSLRNQPSYLQDILIRLLENQPEMRFSSAREIIQALNAGTGEHYELETAETQLSYLYSSHLVGRKRELNRLKVQAEQLLRTPDSEPPTGTFDASTALAPIERREKMRVPIFLLSGEIGIGKTRLYEELTHFLKMKEIPVHAGNCYETCQDAYQPFRELINHAALGHGLNSDVFEMYQKAIVRLCPELRRHGDTEGPEVGFRPDKERLFFIDQLARFLIDSSSRRPCVLAINNLHWIDEASIELLSYLIDEIARADGASEERLPLMLVLTLRSDENLSPPLRELITRLREEEKVRDVLLRRFMRPQITELITNMLQLREIPAPFLDRLEERTSGNPLFVVETLKSLQEEGIIRRENEEWAIDAPDLSRIEIPHGVEAILMRRVGLLDADHQHLLEALAVYDKPVPGKLLTRLPEFSGPGVTASLRELENRGMVTRTVEAGRLYFAIHQPKLREIIYERIEEKTRRRLHGALADALVETRGDDLDGILEDLAAHYQRSDRVGKALEFTLRAGRAMQRIFAHDRAVAHYRHVLRQTEGVPENRATWLETHERIGDIGTISGAYEMAHRSYAILLHKDLEAHQGPLDRPRILRKIAKLDEIQGDYERALNGYRRSRDLLEAITDPTVDRSLETIKTLNTIAWVYACMSRYGKAMSMAVEALQQIEGHAEGVEHALLFGTIGSANFHQGQFDQAIEYHCRALEIVEDLENIPEIVVCLNRLGAVHHACAEYSEALDYHLQALETAVKIGDAFGRAMALHGLAAIELSLGQLRPAEKFLQESLDLSRRYRMRYLTTKNYALQGRLRLRRNDLAKASGDLFRALATFSEQSNLWEACHCSLELVEIEQSRGSHDQALALVDEALTSARTLHVPSLLARGQLLKARTLRTLRSEPGDVLLGQLEEARRGIEDSKLTELLAEIELETGETLLTVGRQDEAMEIFARARERYREVAHRLPADRQESYLALHQIGAGPETTPQQPDAPSLRVDTGAPGRDAGSDELLQVASLLQEFSESGASRAFFQKVMFSVVRAVGADSGFLLDGDRGGLKILAGVNREGAALRGGANHLCVGALKTFFESGEPIVAPEVIQDPRIAHHEQFYALQVRSVAIVPLKTRSKVRGALYLSNPDPDSIVPPSGGPILLAYQNLVALALPQATPTP